MPSNWRELQGNNNSVTFAPEGGYGDYRGQNVFTHGLQVGLESSNARNLRTATDQLIQGLAQSNPQLRQSGSFSNVTIGGRNGLATVLTNVSDATGQPERIALYTTQMSDGSLFFVVGVAPAREFSTYRQIFNRSVQSLQLNDQVAQLAVMIGWWLVEAERSRSVPPVHSPIDVDAPMARTQPLRTSSL